MVEIGDRIRLLYMKDDPSWNKTLHRGDMGTVTDIQFVEFFNERQIWVKFDNGSHLALIEGIDQYEII